MNNCCLVNKFPLNYEVRFFTEKLPLFEKTPTTYVKGTIDIKEKSVTVSYSSSSEDLSKYVSWAIVTVGDTQVIDVEDEDEEQTTQTIYRGGDVVLGKNSAPTIEGNKITDTLYFIIKRNIYN